MLTKEAFVYRWRHNETGVWYIGYHKGTADDGYICSSTTVKPLIEESPEDWTRRILRYGTKTEMIVLEKRILKRLDARRNPKSLNRSNGGIGPPLSVKDRLGYDFLDLGSAEEIAKKYVEELKNGDLQRIYLWDKWLIRKLF